MQIPDLINGCLECAGGFFIALSIVKLHKEKLVRGISWPHVAFFSVWGYWNLFYYPSLDQWLSSVGCGLLALTNTTWLGQIAYYRQREARLTRELLARGDAAWSIDDLTPGFNPSLETPMTWIDKPVLEPVKLYRHCDK